MADPLAHLHSALAGRYTIERELGRGGMATVYLANDLKHRRQVALKVLRPELAAALGPDRFLLEIDIAARLQHPHILPLYDSGNEAGVLYYVMPYIEGESLRSRLQRERLLPFDDALAIAREVADALSYAHNRNVIHRDIKPENILLGSGHALVADFGIARAITAAGGDRLTLTGMTVGTPGYMSPEQMISIEQIDGRSDVYSLGLVLYEMLTGEPPLIGPPALLSAKQPNEPVPVAPLLRELPGAVRNVAAKALALAPADRFATAAEFANALSQLEKGGPLSDVVRPATPVEGPSTTVRRLRNAALIGVTVVGAAIVVRYLLRMGGREQAASSPTQKQLTFTGDVGDAALSEDGQFVAYVSNRGHEHHLMVQGVVGGPALQIASYRAICCLQWSSDGAEILFDAVHDPPGPLIISRLGGVPRPAGRRNVRWGPGRSETVSWSPFDKRIWLTNTATGDTTSIALRGSFTRLVEVESFPAGALLTCLTLADNPRRWTIWTTRVDGGALYSVLEDTIAIESPRWSSRGDALYFVRGAGLLRSGASVTLWKIGVSPTDGKPRGPARLVLADLPWAPRPSSGFGGFTISADGRRLLYARGFDYSNLWLITRPSSGSAGRALQLTTGTAPKWFGQISPDGKQIAFVQAGTTGADVFTVPTGGGRTRQLTFMNGDLHEVAWSPDGKRVAFTATQGGATKVWIVDARGGSARPFAGTAASPRGELAWAPGTNLLYQVPGNRNFRVLNPETGAEHPLVRNDSVGAMFRPRCAPNGNVVAVGWVGKKFSGEAFSGLFAISLTDGRQVQLSKDDYFPMGWSADGSMVYAKKWLGSDSVVYAIPAAGGKARVAFTLPFRLVGDLGITPDVQGVVGLVSETHSDVWMIENFDPDSK